MEADGRNKKNENGRPPASSSSIDSHALSAAPPSSSDLASVGHRLTVRALMMEIHQLQIERHQAANVHANQAAQIGSLTTSLQDALLVQQHLQTKIQLLEYGIKLERRQNIELKAVLAGTTTAADMNEKQTNGVASHSHSASSADLVDPTLLAAYLSAIQSHSTGERSMITPQLASKTNALANAHVAASSGVFASASASTPLSTATSALPSTAIKPRSSKATLPTPDAGNGNGNGANDALSFKYESSKSPSRASAGVSQSPQQAPFKPPTLSASMFMPPTEAEIAAEVALAKSPPVVHGHLHNKDGAALTRAYSDNALSSTVNSTEETTVYNYSTGNTNTDDITTTPTNHANGSQGATTYSYGGASDVEPEGPNLNATAIDMSGVHLQLDASKGNGPLQSGHHRIASSSSAFTPLAAAAAGGAPIAGAISPLGASSSTVKQWRPRLQLRAHLDSVRCIGWDRSADSASGAATWLLSGSEDGTADLWNLTAPLLAASSARASKSAPQPVPCHTYRGHRGWVVACWISSTMGAFTAGVDGQVLQWSLPDESTADLYASHGRVAAMQLAQMKHADSVWSIDVRESAQLLLAAVADGSVAVWQTGSAAQLLRSIRRPGAEKIAPTSVQFLPKPDVNFAVVGYADGVVCVFDVTSGALVSTLLDPVGDSTPTSRITQLVCHSSNPDLVLTAHADASIRYWDLASGERVGLLAAHRGMVSSIDIDPDGVTLVSGAHDESIRVWATQEKKIRQVLDTHQTHRLKYQEVSNRTTRSTVTIVVGWSKRRSVISHLWVLTPHMHTSLFRLCAFFFSLFFRLSMAFPSIPHCPTSRVQVQMESSKFMSKHPRSDPLTQTEHTHTYCAASPPTQLMCHLHHRHQLSSLPSYNFAAPFLKL